MAQGSDSNIMSVGELIDSAFGEPDVNTVNHKLIQTILYLLARQLRILERRVEVEIGAALPQTSSSTLSVTEVKVHAMQKKKTRPVKKMSVKSMASSIGKGFAPGGTRGIDGGGLDDIGRPGLFGKGMAGERGSSSRKEDLGIRAGISPVEGGKGASKGGDGGKGTGKSGKEGGEVSGGGMGMGGKDAGIGIAGRKQEFAAKTGESSSDKPSALKKYDHSIEESTASKSSSDKTTTKSTEETSSSYRASKDKTLEKSKTDKTSTTSIDKTFTDKSLTDKTSTDKTSTDRTSTDKASSYKTSTDKSSTAITSSGRTSSDKTSTDKSTAVITSSDITSSDKTSTDKSTAAITSSDRTSSDKTSTDKSTAAITSSDRTSSDKTSTDKSTAAITSSDRTSSDKTSTDKSSAAITSSDKTSSAKISSDLTSTDKTTTAITSSDKTSSDKTTTDKITTDTLTSDKTSSKDKSSSDKRSTTSNSKSTTDKTSSSKKTTTSETTLSRKSPGDIADLLDELETHREAELRVIHQMMSFVLRADSREEHEKTPRPMASMDSVEATYEKLLIVERIPAEEARAIAARGRRGSHEKAPRVSVVTQEQFERLAAVVHELQEKFMPVGTAEFPENIQLMHELRKGASLTDAMAALQLSARLEAAEKALDQMTNLVTDLATKTPGVDLTEATTTLAQEQGIEVLYGADGKEAYKTSPESKSLKSAMSKKHQSPTESISIESVMISLPGSKTQVKAGTTDMDTEMSKDKITYQELDGAMRELYDDVMKKMSTATAKTTTTASEALKIANRLEGKLNASLNLGTRMQDLEALVSKFSEQINILDTGLSSQMTNYQEELTQMQHDLETALETMAELLANTGGDATAVAELNASLSNLQSDIEDTMSRQTELRNTQTAYYLDLESLRRQIEILRDTKSDREEVADALRDKAGLGALNGLVSILQFDAVRGDIEKRIAAAYDKFNSQEMIWQKVIDELIRELNEKADIIQLTGLKDNIHKHLESLAARMRAMKEIVGEPRAAAVAKKLHRDANCLSCATPADMVLEEHGAIPALPAMRTPALAAEAPKEDGDHAPCYPGRAIPHPIDPRAHVCQRWCGGSHTLLSHAGLNRIPPGIVLTDVNREPATVLGTDGKTYKVDEPHKPCEQCKIISNEPHLTPEVQVQAMSDGTDSGMTPSDFRSLRSFIPEHDRTPPPSHHGD